MRGFQIRIGSGFLLLIALLIFFDDGMLLIYGVPVIIVHELGHILAMRLLSVRPVRLTASLSGFSLDYDGELGGFAELVTALAGPAFGLIFAFFCSVLGRRLESGALLLCAGLGTILNVFNLLPALPLDGGRALRAVLPRSAQGHSALFISGFAVSAALIMSGLYSMSRGHGAALFAAGLWLFISLLTGT